MKYAILLDDKPDDLNKFSGMLQLLRYSKREEHLSMEYRDVPEKDNIDITKKPKLEVYELAVSHKEMRNIRDFLNSLDLEE